VAAGWARTKQVVQAQGTSRSWSSSTRRRSPREAVAVEYETFHNFAGRSTNGKLSAQCLLIQLYQMLIF
jgi:hypothetical protein